ncbi:histidinol phosphatase-like enzyme [Virgibacillus litoralis]|uniref:Histidinol phosphatase-like enzyme n=2 Tax=Virgibacillus litoralis TaxID=578221 RepID=A0ABS4H842_9BACI|nr:histidinol phosphatase-like enzyme [Virgibacillus litoralis]
MIISFTNQPGISRGEAKREEFESELKGFGFDKVYLCPHQQNEGCNCRKPSTGMLLQAAEDNNLNLNQCFVIGDRWTDMLAAKDAGCIQVLVKTGARVEYGTTSLFNYRSRFSGRVQKIFVQQSGQFVDNRNFYFEY